MNTVILGDGLLAGEFVKQTHWDAVSRKLNGVSIKDFPYGWDLDKYDTIINCIANTDTYNGTKSEHIKVNYRFVCDLVKYCNIYNKKLIHISTDHVYANSVSDAKEDDFLSPIKTNYGYSKMLGDYHVESTSNNYLLCRTSFKPYPFKYENAWNDQYTNGDYVNVIASLIVKLIDKNASGVFNVGTKKKTWYELTKDEFNTKPTPSPSWVPKDISMNITKLNDFLS